MFREHLERSDTTFHQYQTDSFSVNRSKSRIQFLIICSKTICPRPTHASSLVGSRGPPTLDASLPFLQLQSLPVQSILHFLVTRIQLLFGYLELALFFLYLLLENHFHLCLHLGKLCFVQLALLGLFGRGTVRAWVIIPIVSTEQAVH